MKELSIQERQDNERIKEIYDTALSQLMTGSIPIKIRIRRREANRLSAAIIQQNLPINSDIIVYVYAISAGVSPSNYLANLYSDETNGTNKLIDEQVAIRHFELPSILEKSYKVDIESMKSICMGKKNDENA